MIPYGKHEVTQDDIDEVVKVLGSDFLTQGPQVPRFEEAVIAYCGARFGVASMNATSALHLACLALGVGKGDIVWTSPVTFVASANCALYCGASVDFVDIDEATWNLSPDALEKKLQIAESNGVLPKVIIAVHLCGQSCDMKKIRALADAFGVHVIEDASHAIGGRYRESAVGSCEFSDITVFSFHPVKIVTTAEGGMAVTNDGELAERMTLLRSHGITRDPESMLFQPDGPWYYEQVTLGYNYRLTDVQAALGRSQLARVDAYVSRRQYLAQRYDELLAEQPVFLPRVSEDCYSAFHLYVTRIDPARCARPHVEVFQLLRDAGISVNLHYIPVYRQPYYRTMGYNPSDYPNAESYYSQAITLPLFPTMTEDMQDCVVEELTKATN